ncbi:ketohydroxyglutarate aldolase [Leptolyngbya sp. GB1-A1]|uniref:ketohydroxyglutarate aldolase n=1 Tax=Leptolyngbya sp. GB1-A1 TaxID=2933908 RepID=UPI0032997737
MAVVRILVSISDDYLDRLSEVSEQLQASGMKIEQVLSTLGVITGEIDAENLSALQTVAGVSNLEEEKPFEAL